ERDTGERATAVLPRRDPGIEQRDAEDPRRLHAVRADDPSRQRAESRMEPLLPLRIRIEPKDAVQRLARRLVEVLREDLVPDAVATPGLDDRRVAVPQPVRVLGEVRRFSLQLPRVELAGGWVPRRQGADQRDRAAVV